jgi:hypothetical protein
VTRPPHRHASWVAKQPRRNYVLAATKSLKTYREKTKMVEGQKYLSY